MDLDPYASMQIGMRVVRGADWRWGNQDSGEGNVGTVVEIGRQGSPATPDKTVVVQWDHGTRTNYRTGFQGAYDLLLYDNAQIGVRHPNIICDCCKKHGIRGMRWKCKVCFDYDLCLHCYMSNKHDLAHAFERYETAHSQPVSVSPRQNLPRITLKGIFQDAKVVRGPDWEWGNQDGGDGKIGRVVDIRGWDVETGRSVASVTWADGTTNVYRVGHKGKVDLKCITEASGGFYYKEHLPKLGKPAELQKKESTEGHPFQHGDKVKCLLDIDILREMQEGHGGWNPKMAEVGLCKCPSVCWKRAGSLTNVRLVTFIPTKRTMPNDRPALKRARMMGCWFFFSCLFSFPLPTSRFFLFASFPPSFQKFIGQTGTVHRITDRGDVRVQFNNDTRWTFHPGALTKVDVQNQGRTALQVASYVGQMEVVKLLVQAHANIDLWDEEETKEMSESSRRRPASCQQRGQPEYFEHRQVHGLVRLCQPWLHGGRESLVRKQLRCEFAGDTPLHYAITADFKCIIEALTEVPGIDFTIQNQQGFNLLHHAALKGNKLAIKKILARARQLVDAKKDDGFTALHLAALNNHKEVAEILIKEVNGGRNDWGDGLQASGFLGNTKLNVGTALACYLAQQGADVNYANHRGKSPLDLILDGSIAHLIQNFSQKY
ncbi:E3 ubiquitin-protein ligase MIB2, partial [Ophiophagus hannah]